MSSEKNLQQGFILEDHAATAEWLQTALTECFDGIRVEVAESIEQARILLGQRQPDIALIDLGLPDGSGIEILQTIQHCAPECLRIVATTFSDDEHLFSALQAGAQGYILKEQDQQSIIDMLAAAALGQPALSPQIARRILGHFQPRDFAEPLTPRQTEVLQLIARGYKNREVADLLEISPHTVHGYIKEIYRILNVSSRSEATLAASKRGLINFNCE